jgi:hypothetical protein
MRNAANDGDIAMSDILRTIAAELASGLLVNDVRTVGSNNVKEKAQRAIEVYDACLKALEAKYGIEVVVEDGGGPIA